MIREMREEDLAAVTEIEQFSFSDPWSEEGFRESLYQTQALLRVVEVGGCIAGYYIFYFSDDEGELVNIAVHPEFRRQGIGTAMIEDLLEKGMSLGVKQFVLEVRMGNSKAISLYKKQGFSLMGIRKGFYTKPTEDALVMVYSQGSPIYI